MPYTVVLVRLEEGLLVTAQLADIDPEEVRIGLQGATKGSSGTAISFARAFGTQNRG